MHIETQTGRIEEAQVDAIILNVFQDPGALGGATGAIDRILNGLLKQAIEAGDFKGKLGETAVFYTQGLAQSPRIILVGIGKQADFGLEAVRRAAAAGAKRAQDMGLKHIATVAQGAGAGLLDPAAAAQAVVEGVLLATYRFADYKSGVKSKSTLENLTLIELDSHKTEAERKGAQAGAAIAAGVKLARDLVNEPPNYLTPTKFAEVAQALTTTRPTLSVKVLGRDDMTKLGMGALLGVAQGSVEPPQFIILEHGPVDDPPVVIVGKGITFDTGGISIKPSARMELMKGDMAGAAAVLGAMQAVSDLALPLHVVGLIATSENMPAGNSIKPADVLTAMNGKTIEIISTDAEGRLVLADALSYAQTLKPAPLAMVDLATLTGAIFVALGRSAAGLFSNNDRLSDQLFKAGENTGERVWRLPLYPEYREVIDSDVADMRNSAGVAPSPAGAAIGAIFIQEFVGDFPWAHLDVASMTYHTASNPLGPKGATGYGVRLLTEFLRQWAPVKPQD